MNDPCRDGNLNYLARRRFLSALGLGALAAAAPVATVTGLTDAAHTGEASALPGDARRWGLLIDTAKCAHGCDDCVRACDEEHGIRGNDSPASLPLMCQHCESAPCVDVCPTGASFRRADGLVLVDKHTCIGCRYCMLACPFKARSFIHENLRDQLPHAPRGKGTVESCTLCVHRIDAAKGATKGSMVPACVSACNAAGHGAMVFGDLNDPEDPLARALRHLPATRLRPGLKLNQGVYYAHV